MDVPRDTQNTTRTITLTKITANHFIASILFGKCYRVVTCFVRCTGDVMIAHLLTETLHCNYLEIQKHMHMHALSLATSDVLRCAMCVGRNLLTKYTHRTTRTLASTRVLPTLFPRVGTSL